MAGDQTPPRRSAAEQVGELLGTVFTRLERLASRLRAGRSAGQPADTQGETQPLQPLGDASPAGPGRFSRVDVGLASPQRRQLVVLAAIALALVLVLPLLVPAIARRAGFSGQAPAQTAPGQQAPPAGQEGAPAPAGQEQAPPAEAPPAPAASPVRQMVLSALPLLLGLFWLLSAWLVDAEARRAFVVQEPWGERRTVAYTILAVGCVFPLILAGLIFSAWGYVTFVLDISRRQNPVAGIQAGALILMAFMGFLVVRGALARWLDQRRSQR